MSNDRKENILKAAIKIAEEDDLYGPKFVSDGVAFKCGCTRSLLFYYYPSIADLRNDVVLHAIANKNKKIIARAVVGGDPLVQCLAYSAKLEALAETYIGG